jgi:two-component system response regulator MprA
MCAARATILIVDDDAGVTQTFGSMLQLEGYNVLSTLDAETGLQAIATNRPDAVLLDLHMPFADGLVFLRRLRAQECDRHTPVAIITGDYSLDETLLSELRELDAVICFKPLWLADLVAICNRLLRNIQ